MREKTNGVKQQHCLTLSLPFARSPHAGFGWRALLISDKGAKYGLLSPAR